jgi:hypothetical protein
MMRNSYPTIKALARRCSIRCIPDRNMVIRIETLLEKASRSISVIPTNSTGNTLKPCSDAWMPPELKLSPQERYAALLQHQQTRNFAWHAGYLEQAKAKDLEETIQSQMTTLMEMIQQLPCTDTADDASTAMLSCCHDMVEQILQQEDHILRLCQDYQRLTGEEFESLPQPNCDESSTVLQMRAS